MFGSIVPYFKEGRSAYRWLNLSLSAFYNPVYWSKPNNIRPYCFSHHDNFNLILDAKVRKLRNQILNKTLFDILCGYEYTKWHFLSRRLLEKRIKPHTIKCCFSIQDPVLQEQKGLGSKIFQKGMKSCTDISSAKTLLNLFEELTLLCIGHFPNWQTKWCQVIGRSWAMTDFSWRHDEANIFRWKY